jgi:hypothetical protein
MRLPHITDEEYTKVLNEFRNLFETAYVDYQFNNVAKLEEKDLSRNPESINMKGTGFSKLHSDAKCLNLDIELKNKFIWDVNDAKFDDILERLYPGSNFKTCDKLYMLCCLLKEVTNKPDIIMTCRKTEHGVSCTKITETHANLSFKSESISTTVEPKEPIESIITYVNSFGITEWKPNSTTFSYNYIMPANTYYRIKCNVPVTMSYDMYFCVDALRGYEHGAFDSYIQCATPTGRILILPWGPVVCN